ncbi:MAG: peptidoglycan DD-metalloendopeptidase family protein [Bacteroidota bacterium]
MVFKKLHSRFFSLIAKIPDTWLYLVGSLPVLILPLLFWGFDKAPQPYSYPVDVFRSLTGTFGEPRSNHFHSGIDIRIGGRIGTPIKASREGYVYRINVNPYGFGKALYLRHPDGQYSVYAHLDRFSPQIEQLVNRRQVSGKQSEIQLFLRPEEIPVKREEVIAYGGNSGSSQGPHLHFEIRDPQERIINPMAYFQGELSDNIAPLIQEIMLTPLNPSSHVNAQFSHFRKVPIRKGNSYYLPSIIKVKGPVGLSYQAIDFLNGARFRCGINYVRLLLDGRTIYRFTLDRFAFSETRYLNHHIDYAIYQKMGKRFEKAFIDKGNQFSAYQKTPENGIIDLKDEGIHLLRLELEDYHGNTSTFEANIQQYIPPEISPDQLTFSEKPHISSEVLRNVLKLTVDCPSKEMFEGLTITNMYGADILLKPSYIQGDALQYLYPLDSLLFPRAVVDHTDSLRKSFYFEHLILNGKNTTYAGEKLHIRFPARAVYQDTYLEINASPSLSHTLGNVYHVGSPEVALHKYITLSLMPPEGISTKKAFVAFRDDEGEWSFQGNQKGKTGMISARVREFGSYALMRDTLAPRINPLSFRNKQTLPSSPKVIHLRLEDDLSGIISKSINAYLNGEWIPFYYDYKNDLITYRPLNPLRSGSYVLEVSAKDEVNNTVVRQFEFQIR